MGKKTLTGVEHGGQLLHVTLNAPKGNVIDLEMISELEGILAREATHPALKAIVFEGAGSSFSYGSSIRDLQVDLVGVMLPRFHGLFLRLVKLEVPTAAIVRGQCLGGGFELVSYCTWIFARHDALFGHPEIRLGIFPPMGSLLLPWRVGGARAVDLCVSGRSIDSVEAERFGLVHSVSANPSEAFQHFFSECIEPKSASSLRLAERAVRRNIKRALETELPEIERLYLEELMKTRDAGEGVSAFLERRPAKWERE